MIDDPNTINFNYFKNLFLPFYLKINKKTYRNQLHKKIIIRKYQTVFNKLKIFLLSEKNSYF